LRKTSNILAVSNTSPISNLASIGRLNLLRQQFDHVLIPEAVATELTSHPDPSATAAIQTAIQDKWIQIRTVRDSTLLRVLLLYLHQGEAEAIALVTEISGSIVLIDEQEGRQTASHVGCAVTGVLGILLRAKRDGQIPAVRPEIELLRSKAKFFVAKSLESSILASAGE